MVVMRGEATNIAELWCSPQQSGFLQGMWLLVESAALGTLRDGGGPPDGYGMFCEYLCVFAGVLSFLQTSFMCWLLNSCSCLWGGLLCGDEVCSIGSVLKTRYKNIWTFETSSGQESASDRVPPPMATSWDHLVKRKALEKDLLWITLHVEMDFLRSCRVG